MNTFATVGPIHMGVIIMGFSKSFENGPNTKHMSCSQFLDSETNGENHVKLRCMVLEKSAWKSVYRINYFTVSSYMIGFAS